MVSQNGWPVLASSSECDRSAMAGVAFPNGVRPGSVAVVFRWLAEQFNARVEPLKPGWCWGYNNRPVTGGTVPSNHASGTAVDFNAPAHPYGKRDTFTLEQRTAIRAILMEANGVLRWGGDYSGNHDDMHFEINKGSASVDALARKIQQAPAPQPPAPADQEEDFMIVKATGPRDAQGKLTGDDFATIPMDGKTLLFIGVGFGREVEILGATGVRDSGHPAGQYSKVELPSTIKADAVGPFSVEFGTRAVQLRHRSDHDFTVWAA